MTVAGEDAEVGVGEAVGGAEALARRRGGTHEPGGRVGLPGRVLGAHHPGRGEAAVLLRNGDGQVGLRNASRARGCGGQPVRSM